MRLIGLSAVLVCLAACTEVGPDYEKPQAVAGSAGNFVSADAAPVAAAAVPAGWWRLYDDPILNDLEKQALTANTDLRVATANLARAAAAQKEVEGAQEIKAGADFAAERAQLSGQSFLLPIQLPSQYLGDGGVRIAYQLDLFGRLKRAAEAAAADRDAVAAGRELAQISVAAEVARAYAEACSAAHELETAERIRTLQSRAVDITAQLAAQGKDSTIEVTRAKAQLEQAQSALPLFLAHQRVALYRLAVLTGRPPADYPRAVEQCREPPRLHRVIPVGDGAQLLQRRPDVRQAERAVAAATARIGVATAALYPDIRLGFSAGSTGLLTELGEPSAEYWGVGPLISWSVPDTSAFARIEGADAAAAAALAQFDRVVLTALRETESSLTIYAHDLDRNQSLRAARDRAAEAALEADQLFKAGKSPYLAGLNAQQSLAGAEQTLALSDDQIATDQITLFLALGGGW
jgi:NodT family efflux transporter outer membrane factor (OMF) lipoprotein